MPHLGPFIGDFQHLLRGFLRLFSGPLRNFVFVPVVESRRNKHAGAEGNLDHPGRIGGGPGFPVGGAPQAQGTSSGGSLTAQRALVSEIQKWRKAAVYPGALFTNPGRPGAVQTPVGLGWISPILSARMSSGLNQNGEHGALHRIDPQAFS